MRRNVLSRRALLCGVAAISTATSMSRSVGAQGTYPSRPIRFVIGFPPGGAADTIARIVGAELSKQLGQQVVVESRAGASGNIATQSVLAAPADGHTILLALNNLASNPSIMDVGYDPHRDLTMVSQLISVPVVVLTHPRSGMTTLPEVIAAARAKNGELRFGGVLGTSSHLGPELLARDQNFKIKMIPYRGAALAVQALLSQEVDVAFDLMSATLQGLLAAGTLRGVAVMQDTPVKGLETLPTAASAGVSPAGFFRSWMGICVKTGTHPSIVARLHQATLAILAQPETRERLEQMGNEVMPSPSPAAFQTFYASEIARIGELIRAIDYRPQ